MAKRFKIGGLNISLVFRHRFEKDERGKKNWDRTFTRWELGLWFRKTKMVGVKDFTQPKKWGDNLVGSYMLGLDMLIFKTWVSWDYKGMHLEMEEPTKK